MKKRIILFVAVATLTLAMTACGSENVNVETEMNGRFEVIKDIEVTTPTAEPTKAVETTIAPTATSAPTVEPTTEPTVEPTATSTPTPEPTATSTPTPTPEPTSTPTPEPTATPVPTSTTTPEPTSTPVPTEAPVVEAKDWETVLRELHSLETYEEREVYIETLDKSKYEVAAVDNFDLFNDNTDNLKLSKYAGLHSMQGFSLKSEPEVQAAIDSITEEYAALEVCLDFPTGEYCLMTITNLTTGETDPWGFYRDTELEIVGAEKEPDAPIIIKDTFAIETFLKGYNSWTMSYEEPVWDPETGMYDYSSFDTAAPVEMWNTMKYYDDLVDIEGEVEEAGWWEEDEDAGWWGDLGW